MIGIYVIAALVLIAGGAALGIVVIVSLGIRREEKARSLTVESPDRTASGARAVMSVSSRRPGVAYQIMSQREDALTPR